MGDRRRGWLTVCGSCAGTCLLVLAVVCCGRSARAALTHLYTFNDGTAHDSVGSADGTLFGAATVDVDGVLQLPGGAGDYASLDGPAIGINSYVDVSFEAWFTSTQLLTWQRVFDFGDRTVPAAQQGYIYYTPQGGNGGGLGCLCHVWSTDRGAAPDARDKPLVPSGDGDRRQRERRLGPDVDLFGWAVGDVGRTFPVAVRRRHRVCLFGQVADCGRSELPRRDRRVSHLRSCAELERSRAEFMPPARRRRRRSG